MSDLSSTTLSDEYLNEQLINCLNVQTNVIENLAQYSQYISLQLIEIKNNVNILANRIFILQQQQEQSLPPPPNPLLYFPSTWQQVSSVESKPLVPFSFAPTVEQQPSRNAPFVFDSISSNHVDYSDEEDEDEDDDDDEDGSPIPFDIMRNFLPSDMNLGDQNEKILFSEHAKLLHFDPSINQLKERGNGELMILQHKTSNISRILMLQDEELDICANHRLTPQLELKSHQTIPYALVWSVLDFGTGEARYETFCVKFKTDEHGKQFMRIFNEAKNNLPSIERISLNDDDPIPLDQLQAIAEQFERSHSYDDTPSTNESRHYYSRSNPQKSLDSSSTSRGLQWSSDEATDSHPSPPKPQRQIIKAKRSLPSNRIPPPMITPTPQISPNDEISTAQTHQKKSRNLPANRPMDTYAGKMVENILDEVKDELHKQKAAIVTIDDENSKSSDAGFPFGNYGTRTDFQFASKMPSTFANLSKLNLTRQSSSSSDQSGERGPSSPEDNYEPPIPFKPIVHLQPVVVKTGEEEENILFRERAKLYRFDNSTNEFKERGIGDLKILQHQTSHRCRIVMRRDQVFKVCANHRLNDQMELQPHPEKDNAYIWSAMDSSDGPAKEETLYVKFKTSDIAERFFQEFNRAKHLK